MLNATVRQEWGHLEIELRDWDPKPFSGSISVFKRYDIVTLKLEPATVRVNLAFNASGRMIGYTPNEARQYAHLFTEAATLAEQLDAMILTRDDLVRPVEVKVIGRSFVPCFKAVDETEPVK